MTKQQPRKRVRSSDDTEVDNDSATKKSKRSESSANDVNQSTSTSAKDPFVQSIVAAQQPCTSHQRSVRFDLGEFLSSGETNKNNTVTMYLIIVFAVLFFSLEDCCMMIFV